jgi:hypothetical protein
VLLSTPAAPVPLRSTSPAVLGCGEHHVLAPGNHPPSRRTEFVFFSGSGTPTLDCPSYPGWRNTCAPVPTPRPQPPATATFHVSPVGNDTTGDGTVLRPWATFRHSFAEIHRVRLPGQAATLNVLGGIFNETIRLPSSVTVEGVGTPLPEVHGEFASPALLASGTRDSTVRRLKLAQSTRSGVRIENARDVALRDCQVSANTAPRGGGISIVDSTGVTVQGCDVHHNQAGTIAQAITVANLEVSISTSPEIQEFDVTLGDSHGGGIYVQGGGGIVLRGNRVRENRAILFGGGIAVDNPAPATGSVEIVENVITCNQVSHGDLAALGAAVAACGDDMGDPVATRLAEEVPVTGASAAERAVPLLHGVGFESGVGGGVALRNVGPRVRLVRNHIGVDAAGAAGPNRARRGGGVEIFTGAYPALEGNEIAFNLSSDDGGGISVDQFDPFLPAGQATFLGFSRRAMVPRQTIEMVDNHLHDNRCREDGGAIYATGAPRLHLSGAGTRIIGNCAGENGGGIRISYAAVLRAEDITVSGNQSNVIGTEREGGGGIAARNAEIHLARCTVQANVANGFAGGGLFVTSTFEGGFGTRGFIANRRGQFDAIMAADYGFTTRHYHLTDARGSGNQALGGSGAGGYMYALRDPGVSDGQPLGGEQPLHVTIEGAATAIGADTSQYLNADAAIGTRKRANVTIELSGQADAAGRARDRVRITGLAPVPASVALSTPTPGEKAIVVLHARTRTPPDEQPTTFPYQNVGPAIMDVQPRFGAAAGGTRVSITGSGFLDGATVTFGGAAATVVSVAEGEVRVDTAPHAAGVVDVVVANPDGKADTVAGGFEHTVLSLASLAPAVGAADQTTAAVLHGSGFLAGVRVFVGSQPCTVDQRVRHVELHVTVPASPTGAAATGDVDVANPGGETVSVANAFRWALRPRVTDVRPRGGAPAGGSHVRVTGQRFGAGTELRIGGRAATVTAATATTLDAVVPAQASGAPPTVDVEATNPDGLSDTVPGAFTYANGPVVSGLLPQSGTLMGGTQVSILGSGFTTGSRVRFGAAPAVAVFASPMQIDAQAPPLPVPMAPGPVSVTVENPDGQLDTVPGAFTYT